MYAFSIIINDSEAIKVLQECERLVTDLTPILKDISLFIQARIRYHFDNELGSQGKWIKSKRAIIEDNLTLTHKEKLRNSFEKDSAYRFTKMSMEVVTDIVYATTHQYGLTVNIFRRGKPYKFAKRDFVWLSKEDIKYIEQLIITYFNTGITSGIR